MSTEIKLDENAVSTACTEQPGFLQELPHRLRATPVEKLILAHNFGVPVPTSGDPELMLVTCIDYRIHLRIPEQFAYVLRRAAGILQGQEFNLSYALSRGVNHLVLLAHDDCGMTRVPEHREPILNALIRHGWQEAHAESFVDQHTPHYAIGNELDALESECKRIKRMFPKLEVVPLFLCLEENRILIPDFVRLF